MCVRGANNFPLLVRRIDELSERQKDRLRVILGLPAEVVPAIVSPLGYPEAFPTGLAPALKRNFRGWKALVHDDKWGNVRE